MCGFVAIYNPQEIQKKYTLDLLSRMTRLIEHRGPDNQDFFINQNIMMSHRRLSILDLSKEANQPMTDSEITIVFNGEIYNYIEIKDELERDHNIQFKTNSDTEVIIKSYKVWGESCVEKFNGMFAFVLWDSSKSEIYFARDRLGVKPFYYYEDLEGTVFLASDIKSLWEVQSLENNLNYSAIRNNLANGFFRTNETSTNAVHKLPPSNHGICNKDGIKLSQYWDLHSVAKQKISYNDAILQTEELIKDSIKLRLRSDVPLGTFLSGGIDSSLVTAIASQESGNPLNTFSIGLDDKRFDESKYAYQVARKYGTKHHHTYLDHKCLDSLPEVVWMFSDLYGDSSAMPAYLVSKQASEKLKVVFTGDGADEIFGGYPIPYAVYLSEFYKRTPKAIREKLGTLGSKIDIKKLPRQMRWLLRFNELSLMNFDQLNSSFCLNNAWGGETDESKITSDQSSKTLTHRILLSEIDDRMINDYLVKVDMSTMAHSIEGRSPFLDYRIAEFGFSIPENLLFHRLTRKSILKKISESYFDKNFIHRRKMGFSIPLSKWLSEPEYIDLVKRFSEESLLLPKLIEKEKISSTIIAFQSNPNHNASKVWSLLWLTLWEKLFITKSIDRKTRLSEMF
jgi:asparagine synthase (glutamine-hydrolysing)